MLLAEVWEGSCRGGSISPTVQRARVRSELYAKPAKAGQAQWVEAALSDSLLKGRSRVANEYEKLLDARGGDPNHGRKGAKRWEDDGEGGKGFISRTKVSTR